MTNRQLAVLVTEKPKVGYILVPYYVFIRSESINIDALATPIVCQKDESLTAEQLQLVATLHNINEQSLTKQFSKSKVSHSFFASLDEPSLSEVIRPYIDKQICAALPLIKSTATRVFISNGKYRTIYNDDELVVANPFACRPKFFFTLTTDGNLLYTLKASDGIEDISLTGNFFAQLSESPAVFVSGNKLLSFKDIQSKRFVRFPSLQRVVVKSDVVDKYMQTFVANSCLPYFSARAYGFDITNLHARPHAILKATIDVWNIGFSLYFAYDDHLCSFADKKQPVSLHKDNGKYRFEVMSRNFHSEKTVADLLTEEMGLTPCSVNLFTPDGKSHPSLVDLCQWATLNCQALAQQDIEVCIENNDGQKYYSASYELQVGVSRRFDWFDIDAVVIIGQWKIPFKKFLQNIADDKHEYVLPDGIIFMLPDEWFEQWGGVARFFSYDHSDHLSLSTEYNLLLPEYLQSDTSLADVEGVALADVQRVGRVEAQLRPYQEAGVRWLIAMAENNRGAILADDMGLGKTLQTAALLSHVYATRQDNQLPSLIIMPSTLLFNWHAELQRFVPQLQKYTYVGKQALDNLFGLERLFNFCNVILTTYGYARQHISALQRFEFDYIIFDESQTIKNPKSKTYQALSTLRSRHKLSLTGTPIENNLRELWAQINLVSPNSLGSLPTYEHTFVHPIEVDGNEERLSKLKALAGQYILRRTKTEVLSELPKLTIQTILCDMSDEQRELYEREKSAVRNYILSFADDQQSKRFVALQALTKLRQLANHPRMCVDDYEGSSGKADAVLEHLTSIVDGKHKVLVFSSFVRDLELLASQLQERGIRYEYLTGQTHDRQSVVSRFSNDDDIKVLLMTIKVGGVGLNLTVADYVLIINPWWNPASEAQAYSRAHRMGQANNVSVYRFISKDSIEEKIDVMQRRKAILAKGILDVSVPTDDELNELLS